MVQSTVLLIILSAIIATALAWVQYLYKATSSAKFIWLLFLLRAAGVFSVLVLLVNPKFIHTEYFSEKPNLVLAIDNSTSIESFGDSGKVVGLVASLLDHPKIQGKFNVNTFTFGEELNRTNSLSFSENQTNIQKALRNLGEIYKNTTAPTILITDGNQTFGENYQFEARKYPHTLLPIVVGDTLSYRDLSISRINVNRYAFLNNQFPIELFLNYSGDIPVQSKLQISKGNSVVYSTTVEFDQNESSPVVKIPLLANTIGVSIYRAEILPLTEEKNIANNQMDFAVDVIDERTSVLIVSSLAHPDLGALRRSIESNQQREVKIVLIDDVPAVLDEFELIILYQPSNKFGGLWEELKREGRNYMVVSGPKTDWTFLNQVQGYFQKELSGQIEEYVPVLNSEFQTFQLENIGYSKFPPLIGSFGELSTQSQVDVLLFQQIQGIPTKSPLLAIVEDTASKKAFLFGAGLWKWRAQVFVDQNSFEPFDKVIGNLVQYLASTQKRERISLNLENIYYGNENIQISAQYFDENYNFDSGGSLQLELTNLSNQESQVFPMGLAENEYLVKLGSIPASKYSLRVQVEGTDISAAGTFTILGFEVENQFTSANIIGLQQMVDSENEKLYFPDDIDELIKALISDNNYVTVQKSRQNHVSLIDWYYLLAITVLFFSAEWFLRKYHGLI